MSTILKEAHIKPIDTFSMKKRLSWFGHVQRRDDDNVAKSVLNTQIDGSRPRDRPKLRWLDRLKDDMKQNKTRPEWTSESSSWHETSTLPRKRRKGDKVRSDVFIYRSVYPARVFCLSIYKLHPHQRANASYVGLQ